MKKVLIGILMLIIFTGCKNKSLIDITYDELKTKIENKESFVLYVGSTNCSHCAKYKPQLEKVINKYNLDVYYINMANLSKAKADSVLKKVDGPGTPMTVYIEKGKTKTSPRIEGEQEYEDIVEFFKELKLIKGD